jgi:hypothetical protein
MPHLTWISDADLKLEVEKILETAYTAIREANNKLNKNVIDPFAVIFEMAGFHILEVSIWEIGEKSRQAQKSLSNAFGTFHQSILGHANGWTDLGIGRSADLECDCKKILAEVKNKFNTVKGAAQVDVYDHLHNLVMPISSKYRGYTAYYVEIIPKPRGNKPQSYNEPFTPSDKATKTKRSPNELIRRIDGKSFYALVTGVNNAIEQLYDILPTVIEEVSGNKIPPYEVVLMKNYFKKAFA